MGSSSECGSGAAPSSCLGGGERAASASRSDSRPARRFPSTKRLGTRREFLKVYERGHRVATRSFVLFGLESAIAHSRIGITVTRKCGNAVVRNRVKRLVREVFRRHQEELVPPMDLVLNARLGMERARLSDLEHEFVRGFGELGRRARK